MQHVHDSTSLRASFDAVGASRPVALNPAQRATLLGLLDEWTLDESEAMRSDADRARQPARRPEGRPGQPRVAEPGEKQSEGRAVTARRERPGARPERPRRPSSPDSPWDACGRDRVWGRPHSRGRAPSLKPRVGARLAARVALPEKPGRSRRRRGGTIRESRRVGSGPLARLLEPAGKTGRNVGQPNAANREAAASRSPGRWVSWGEQESSPHARAAPQCPPRLFRLGFRHNGLYNRAAGFCR